MPFEYRSFVRRREAKSPPSDSGTKQKRHELSPSPTNVATSMRPLIGYSSGEDDRRKLTKAGPTRGRSSNSDRSSRGGSPQPRSKVSDKRSSPTPPPERSVTRGQGDKFVVNVTRRNPEHALQVQEPPQRQPSSPPRRLKDSVSKQLYNHKLICAFHLCMSFVVH